MRPYILPHALQAVSVAVPVAGGFYIGRLTASDVDSEWYKDLKKPKYHPPRASYAPVWGTLYVLSGLAAWRVFIKAGSSAKTALGLYVGQLALNLAWMPIFFKRKSLKLAAADAGAMLGLLTAATVLFYKKDKVAGGLLAPVLAYSAYATALSFDLAAENDPQVKKAIADARAKASSLKAPKLPAFKAPSLPKLPAFKAPSLPKLPAFKAPSLPKLSLPQVSLPKISLPALPARFKKGSKASVDLSPPEAAAEPVTLVADPAPVDPPTPAVSEGELAVAE